jgi:hypothetical protein
VCCKSATSESKKKCFTNISNNLRGYSAFSSRVITLQMFAEVRCDRKQMGSKDGGRDKKLDGKVGKMCRNTEEST